MADNKEKIELTQNKGTVLVTGAYGFLGKYIINELKANGYKVIAFGRNRKKLDELEGVYKYLGDFTNYGDISNAVKRADYVVHAGALSTVWGKRSDFILNNVTGTANVIKACNSSRVEEEDGDKDTKKSIRKLIYISSPSIYCRAENRLNIVESDFDKNNKMSYYIESKIKSEKLFNHCHVPYTILRPRGLIGIGDTSIIPRLIKANSTIGIPLFNNGDNIIDMTCVENVAYAVRLALEHEESNNNVYNITNDEPTRFKELLDILIDNLNITPKYLHMNIELAMKLAGCIEHVYKLFSISKEPPITRYTVCTLGYTQTMNIDRARKDLEYSPKISLYDGVRKYAKDIKFSGPRY